MEVVAGADEGVRSDQGADCADEVGFGVVEVFGRHCAMHIEIDAIPGASVAQAGDDLGFEVLIRRAAQDSAR